MMGVDLGGRWGPRGWGGPCDGVESCPGLGSVSDGSSRRVHEAFLSSTATTPLQTTQNYNRRQLCTGTPEH